MDKKSVKRMVMVALMVLLTEQLFFLVCGFGLPGAVWGYIYGRTEK